jgi:hypothetical protein
VLHATHWGSVSLRTGREESPTVQLDPLVRRKCCPDCWKWDKIYLFKADF